MICCQRRTASLHRQGFTTPELLMTILVFSMGLLPLIVLFQNSHRTTAQAKHLMIAQSLGRTLIDEVRSLGYEGILAMEKNDTVFHPMRQVGGPLVPSDPDSITYPDYYGRFRTRVSPTILRTDNKATIEVEVAWDEPNRTFTLGFGTVVVKYGAKY